MNLDQVRTSPRAALTVTDVARLLELDERTVRRACEDGDLPSLRVGRRLLLPRLPLLTLLGADSHLTDSESAAATAAPLATTEPTEGAHIHGDTVRRIAG